MYHFVQNNETYVELSWELMLLKTGARQILWIINFWAYEVCLNITFILHYFLPFRHFKRNFGSGHSAKMRNDKMRNILQKSTRLVDKSYHVICVFCILPPAEFRNLESEVRKAPARVVEKIPEVTSGASKITIIHLYKIQPTGSASRLASQQVRLGITKKENEQGAQIAAAFTTSLPWWRHMSLTSYWWQQRMSLTC